jgi:cysteine desulfurase
LYNITMMTKVIYFDYAATTPVLPEVLAAMQAHLGAEGIFGNPSSAHFYGWQAEQAVLDATAALAACVNCQPDEIIWTSSATEANNLAIKGLYYGAQQKPAIATMSTEHPAVLEVCQFLEGEDAQLSYLKPNSEGLLPVLPTFNSKTLLSIMMVNNETGVVQDIKALAEQAKAQSAIVHVDAAQALGKLPIDLSELPVDMMSFSGHKTYGPKGVGALFVRKSLQAQLQAQMLGGGQQHKLRSGTLAPALIVGMSQAACLSVAAMPEESKRLVGLREQLWAGIADLPGIQRHGAPEHLAPHILCVSFDSLPAQQLLEALPGLAISSGSACHSTSLHGNPVLKSMGLTERRALNSLRFSLGRYTTPAQIEQACQQLRQAVQQLGQVRDDLWRLP